MRVKICGLSTAETVKAAVDYGADYFGFVFFEASPRNVTPETAAQLAAFIPVGKVKTGLFVNPSIEYLRDVLEVVPLDMIQLHGKESPEFAAQVKEEFGLPVMKALGVAEKADLAKLLDYQGAADQFLLDAKPNPNAKLPGGNGLAFDWELMRGVRINVPWMLAGGLDPQNVRAAISATGAQQVDVSSGVEAASGVKDIQKIEAFIKAAKGI